MKKENIYINLQGKSKEELTELYWLLKNNNEKILNDGLDLFIRCYLNIESKDNKFHFYNAYWSCAGCKEASSKQEVTIQQLKEILQPMDLTLEQRLEKAEAEAEVKRLKEAIEEENKPKIGDWVYNKEEDIIYQKSYNIFNQYENKIANPELIKLLEKEL